MNLSNNLERSAYFFPEKPALSEAGNVITYEELNKRVNRIATGIIELGIKPGEHIGICAPNSSDWIAIYFGILKAGAIAVTYSSLLSKDELILLVGHSKPRFIFSTEDKFSTLDIVKCSSCIEKIICQNGDLSIQQIMDAGSDSFKAIERDRVDTAAILYTGGTTGIPKGVMLTHEGIIFSSHAIAYYEHSSPKDHALCFQPFNHVFGQIHIMNATIYSGGCVELLQGADIEKILKVTEAGNVTKFFSVPTVYVRLLQIPDLKKKLGNVSYCFSAAASMAREIVKQWKEITGITITESYGMTECMPISFNHYYWDQHVVGSVGENVCGVEIEIRETSGQRLETGTEGEICVRGRNVMKGYLNNPEATKDTFWEDGWLRTGDIGYLDSNGLLYIVDRLKDLIITGGENVFPREVEEALYTVPEICECSVVGLPHNEWGECVTAFVKVKSGMFIEPDKIKAYLKTRLSPFKVPKEYIVLEDLPKSPAGKILKRKIKKLYLEKKL